jgi:SAM-dependent methyltransferase
MFTPVIPNDCRPYLDIQQGALSDLRHDRVAWDAAYAIALNKRYEMLEGWLPSGGVRSILDVGGGMGGFSALLAKAYSGLPEITILDGFDDPPTVVKHNEPFSNAIRAGAFLSANGVKSARFIDARSLPPATRDSFDLIISQQAWGFHFEPSTYLKWVMDSATDGAIIVLDLRREANHWAVQLFSQHYLEPVQEIDPHPDSKFTIGVFQVDRLGKSLR